ncbi:MAG: 3-deoxy-D-manno-octulosonate 8-phosphate phosphatase [Flavobacteriales bacterium]|nr:3-deoxy-D-manno-octulosonate 8-phosphate phosphatase [Flavobacteriales bacterium]
MTELELKDKFASISHFFFDVDGVLTDGRVMVFQDGKPIRVLSSKDGYAIQLAVKKGYSVTIITGGNSEDIKQALLHLGANKVYLKSSNKLEIFEEHCLIHEIDPAHCLYMGDDIPDYEVMTKVGIATCPRDAAPEIIGNSLYVSDVNGGEGCVRDVIEKVLKLRGDWFVPKSEHSNFNEFTW